LLCSIQYTEIQLKTSKKLSYF